MCGEDHASGRNFEHRHGWIVARITQLAAFAVMGVLIHVVRRVDAERAGGWSRDETIDC